jgi:hypothetical protein
MDNQKDPCPCKSGCALNFVMMDGEPYATGYDGPAEIVTSFRLPSGKPVVLAKCGSCGKVPMFRSAGITWVNIPDMLPEEKTFYEIDPAN